MTPLAVWLARFVPQPLVVPVLVCIYAGMMMGLILFAGSSAVDIAYVDVGRP